jgi:hypothetical protein
VLGGDRSAVERAITVTDRNAAVMSVPVLLSVGGDSLNVKVAAAKDHVGGEVWLCPLARSVPVDIGRGENHGRTVTYHNVVRRWLKLGDYAGTDAVWNVPIVDILGDDIDGAVVLVQQGSHDKPGIILGAAFAPVARQTTEVREPATQDR